MVDMINKFQARHDKNIVHADIEPDDFMMNGDNFRDIRIVDLGVLATKGAICSVGRPTTFGRAKE